MIHTYHCYGKTVGELWDQMRIFFANERKKGNILQDFEVCWTASGNVQKFYFFHEYWSSYFCIPEPKFVFYDSNWVCPSFFCVSDSVWLLVSALCVLKWVSYLVWVVLITIVLWWVLVWPKVKSAPRPTWEVIFPIWLRTSCIQKKSQCSRNDHDTQRKY